MRAKNSSTVQNFFAAMLIAVLAVALFFRLCARAHNEFYGNEIFERRRAAT
jgi:hypothetical protein